MNHAALKTGSVAVVTGGASGIGLASAKRFAQMGLRVCIADLGKDRLANAAAEVTLVAKGGQQDVMTLQTDVSKIDDLRRLEQSVNENFGGTDVLMNNAGIQPGSKVLDTPDNWQLILGVNLLGAIHSTQIFLPSMIKRGRPGLVINTGSKQGITSPPGDPAYNVSKVGLKVFTESLQHDLRNRPNCQISAHLLIPGFVFTPLTANGRTKKPAGAWTPEQTADFMLDSLQNNDFYILCPDNDVPRSLDERRILWAAGDIVENRPPLSRWHPNYADEFEKFSRRND